MKNSITVKSLPLKDVITDIADSIGARVYEDCEEYCVRLPKEYGRGTIRGINFKGGLGLIIYDCTFNDDLEIRFTVSKVHPAKFIYCLSGNLQHSFEESEDDIHALYQFQSMIVASSKHNGHILSFKKGVSTKMSSLEVLRSDFLDKIACDLKEFGSDLKGLFTDDKADRKFMARGMYGLTLHDLFAEIEAFEGKGILRKLYLEGKAYDVLAQQIMLYLDDSQGEGERKIIRKSEVEAIEKAIKYIEANLHTPLSVNEICEEVGVNSAKLQNGFKILKGSTVKSFIKNTRLEAAKRLLTSTDMNISEIVYKLGLSNRGYFSRLFKEKYGISPSEMKKEEFTVNRE
jgi:AraC-like DNA-binding protein